MQRKLIFLVKSGKFNFMNNKILTKIILICVFLVSTLSLWAEDGSRVKEFYSPYFISGTSSVTNLLSPQSESINPASGALTQRVTLDFSYVGLMGDDSGISGYKGHGINIGNTIPTKAGVLSWSGHYFYSPFSSIYSDSTFSLNASFSKDLYPDFLVGAGIKLAGSLEPGMSAMLDFGVISFVGNLGPFKDFSWGLALQDLGYSGISTAYPEPISISAGVRANVLRSKNIKIDASADFDITGLTDFKSVAMTFGTNITFKDSLTLNIGSRINSYDLLNNNTYSLIPSIGINYSFKTNIKENADFLGISEKGWNKSEVNIQSGISALSDNLWATGFGVNIPLGLIDKSAPVIKIDISGFESENTDDPVAVPVSMMPAVNFISKDASGRVYSLAASDNVKVYKKNRHIIKTVVNGEDKYSGRIDKRFPDTTILSYMSPNNDGIKDDLSFPINISDTRYIKGYAFIIKDSDGNIVREIRNKEKRIENQGFNGFFKRLFSVKSGISIPDKFRWDGLLDTGAVADDGLYYFSVQAWDDNGNIGNSDSYSIVLDTTAPHLDMTEPDDTLKIFSPNGDGNKDDINIIQTGSDEDLWSASFIDSNGNIVRTFQWLEKPPSDIKWDGRDENGVMVADGVYSYKIGSVDRAGNSISTGFSNIIKNTEITPISINIDKSFFSPNNDMILDTLTFTPDIPVKQGIVSWNLNIKDTNDNVLRTYRGENTIPDTIIFDGRESSSVQGQEGIRMEEGRYTALIDVIYKNGNHPTAISPEFNIDVSPPVANIKSDSSIFSPNGDGLKDKITFYQDSSVEVNWTGIIKSKDGKIITEYQWLSAAEPSISWDGTDSNGRLAPDGDYTYQLITIDRAGNSGNSEIISFTLNTEKTPVILTRDLEYFSPNGDKNQDYVTIIPELKIKSGIDSYSLTILDSDSKIVRNFSGTNKIPEKFIWDGTRSDGRLASDGIYSSKLAIVYKKGDAPIAQSPTFIIDTVYPTIKCVTDYKLFSPDSDGNKDFLEINQSSSSEELWKAEIISNKGTIVRTYFWKGFASNLRWYGKDDDGNFVPDGSYNYIIHTVDKAGNVSSSEIRDIRIDTKPTTIFLTVNDKYLSPTGNGLFENLKFSTIVNNKQGLESWSLKIFNTKGKLEKEFKGNSGIPKNITWNGLNKDGKIIEGSYYAIFSVIYTKGNKPVAKSSDFIIDISPPSGSMQISPTPFSPDNDGVDDELTIRMKVTDASGLKKWTLRIDDPEKRPFKIYSGKGAPAEKIIWDGKSSSGELVYAAMDYPVSLILEDILGNTITYHNKIPVDVLVVREGDILKIKIANILFQKNSPKLLSDSPKVIAQNKFILTRVSELLKKYKTYRITIVGHAVLTKWNDPVAAKIEEETELGPLSEKRAMTVENYLTRLGIDPSRMDSKGMGGKEPLVPFSDLKNRWKDRRVEFILWKE